MFKSLAEYNRKFTVNATSDIRANRTDVWMTLVVTNDFDRFWIKLLTKKALIFTMFREALKFMYVSYRRYMKQVLKLFEC